MSIPPVQAPRPRGKILADNADYSVLRGLLPALKIFSQGPSDEDEPLNR